MAAIAPPLVADGTGNWAAQFTREGDTSLHLRRGDLVLCEVLDDGEQRAQGRCNVGRRAAANGDLVYNLCEQDELGFQHPSFWREKDVDLFSVGGGLAIGTEPRIHRFSQEGWFAGTSPAMTREL